MNTRPRLQPVLKPIDKIMELLGYILLLLLWIITLYALVNAPAIIPIHFDASGKVDGYGKKATILFLAFIPTLLFVGLTQLNKYPHLFNYMTTITEVNAEQQYRIATRFLRYLKAAILLLFNLIVLHIYLTAMGLIPVPAYGVLLLLVVLIFIPTAVAIYYSLKS